MMETTPIITYLGQSGFKLEYNNSTLIIDPSNKASGDYDGALIYCTHKHNDHIGGVDIFLERNPSATLVCNEQTAAKFSKWGDRVKVVNDGETYANGPWSFRFTLLKHGLFRGIQNLAVVVSVSDFSFAHCGDAAEFSNFPPEPVDVLAIPIGGGPTAGPGTTLKMIVKLQEPRPTIVPIHWLFRKPSGFCKKLHQQIPNIKCIVPVTGERLTL